METINIISIITIAFLGSFGHCIGMCGGIVVAYSSAKIDEKTSRRRQAISHLLYSFGRVSTYVAMGVLFGYLGSAFAFDGTMNGVLKMVVGVVMVLTGLSLVGQIKFLTIIEHSLSNAKWYKKVFQTLIKSKSYASFYSLGLLNGLLPCGFVYFFVVNAASTANPLHGALVMLIFGLSTIPALFSLGFFVGILKNTDTRGLFIKIAAIAVVIYGISELFKGYMLFISV